VIRRAEQEAAWRAEQVARNAELRRWNEQWRRRTEKLQRAWQLEHARASKPKKPEPERPQEPPSKAQPRRRRRPQASPGHVWRSCIVCHRYFDIERYARKAPSRCPEHRSGWDAKPKERDLVYADPTYKRLRAEILAPKPLCSYPGCRLVADTLDHIVPVSRGGQNTRENLRPMCRRHNEALGRAAGNETKRRRKS
jgi:5-methylcytosine-specific restriction endonuclease McrA